jgi:hypothetical protein
MKAILSSLFIFLLMVGCGSPNMDDPETLDKILEEAVDANKLQERGKGREKLYYEPNKQKSFTGWAKLMHDNGQIKYLGQFKDGECISEEFWKPNGEKIDPKVSIAQAWVNGAGKTYVMMYFARVGNYPESLGDLLKATNGITIVNRSSELNDPWGKQYQFTLKGSDFELWATTPDGKRISSIVN